MSALQPHPEVQDHWRREYDQVKNLGSVVSHLLCKKGKETEDFYALALI